MRHFASRAAAVFLTPLLVAGAARAAEPDDTLAAQARVVLQTHCAGCHGPEGKARGGFDYVLDRDRLVARNKLAPGDAAASLLYQRVLKGEMPPPGKRPPPAPEEVTVMRRWIDAGAPAAAAPAPASPVTDAAVARLLLADLQALEPRQRRFTRYFTLAHLAAAGASADDLEMHRRALAKLVNSLSWHARVTRPSPVDAARTVYRIDLRDYKWTARRWERLTAAYPYRLDEPGAASRRCAELAGAGAPCLRGDWFLANASRPPLYHDVLELPASDRALERLLQVDAAQDIADDSVARAGFNGSGVAANNRVIERHDAAFGAYWRSYDFSGNTGRQNLFERPLGPGPGGFVQAGGEILFHLPNGLQGYLLVDGAGRRIDKAPVEVVSDPKRPDKRVETGLSCMACHVRGLLPKDDQVRSHVLQNPDAFSRADRETVLALYPPADRMRALMDEDVGRFLKALERAGVPPEEPEPVSTAALRYEAVLDLAAAAAETGRTPDDFAARLRRSPELSRTLGPLLSKGGTVQRQAFEDSWPELAKTFHLGEDDGPVEASAPPASPAFSGHEGRVEAVSFAPDGRRVVTCGEDKTVRLWDAATGKEMRRFDGHTDEVLTAAVSPDGRLILSCGDDRTVRLWDVDSGKELDCLTGHTGAVAAVVFSPDGRSALSGGCDRTVRLWDLAAGKEKARWDAGTEVYAVAFSADGRQGLSGGADGTVRLWDVSTGKENRRFTGHANAVVRVAFAPDGRRVLSAASRYRTPDRVVRVWDAAEGKEIAGWDGGDSESVGCAAFSLDGGRVLLGRAGGLTAWTIPK